MKTKILLPLLLLLALLVPGAPRGQQPAPQGSTPAELPAERHLRNVRQLTFEGENAEAYWSGDGRSLIFQSKSEGRDCDQIYTVRADGTDRRMVSTGGGATTCSYF